MQMVWISLNVPSTNIIAEHAFVSSQEHMNATTSHSQAIQLVAGQVLDVLVADKLAFSPTIIILKQNSRIFFIIINLF